VGGRNEFRRRVGVGRGGHDVVQCEAAGLAQADRPVPDVEDAGGCVARRG
jgi:H2-forming N5,N10-methylenetetrahydromethanopterin dehydrogenase-like enzyme